MRIQNLTPMSSRDLIAIDRLRVAQCDERANASPEARARCEDEVLVFQPQEVFSFHAEWDLGSIRDRAAFNEYCAERGVGLCMMRRGGGMMWHGSGQIVLEPFLDLCRLEALSTKGYAAILEETLVRTCARFGINARQNHYRSGAQGAWVYDDRAQCLKKIGFLGWRQTRGIAMHGAALNVSNDLYPLSLINPCNLEGVEAASMKEVLGNAPPIEDVAEAMIEIFVRLLEEKK